MCCDSVTDENTNIRGSRQYRRNRLRDILCIINEIFLGSICLGSGCESRSSTGSTVARTTIDSRRICRNHSRGKTSSPALFLQCFPREEWPKETFKESQRPLSQCALQKTRKKMTSVSRQNCRVCDGSAKITALATNFTICVVKLYFEYFLPGNTTFSQNTISPTQFGRTLIRSKYHSHR